MPLLHLSATRRRSCILLRPEKTQNPGDVAQPSPKMHRWRGYDWRHRWYQTTRKPQIFFVFSQNKSRESDKFDPSTSTEPCVGASAAPCAVAARVNWQPVPAEQPASSSAPPPENPCQMVSKSAPQSSMPVAPQSRPGLVIRCGPRVLRSKKGVRDALIWMGIDLTAGAEGVEAEFHKTIGALENACCSTGVATATTGAALLFWARGGHFQDCMVQGFACMPRFSAKGRYWVRIQRCPFFMFDWGIKTFQDKLILQLWQHLQFSNHGFRGLNEVNRMERFFKVENGFVPHWGSVHFPNHRPERPGSFQTFLSSNNLLQKIASGGSAYSIRFLFFFTFENKGAHNQQQGATGQRHHLRRRRLRV